MARLLQRSILAYPFSITSKIHMITSIYLYFWTTNFQTKFLKADLFCMQTNPKNIFFKRSYQFCSDINLGIFLDTILPKPNSYKRNSIQYNSNRKILFSISLENLFHICKKGPFPFSLAN